MLVMMFIFDKGNSPPWNKLEYRADTIVDLILKDELITTSGILSDFKKIKF